VLFHKERSYQPQLLKKLRKFIFLLRRNLCLESLLNRYITGAPQRQKDTSLKRKEAGPELWFDAGRDGGVMSSMKSWMLAAAVVVAGLGAGSTMAQAAQFGIYVRGPVAYVPPCPGPGYFWVAGYQSDGYWMPGRWEFRGMRGPVARFDGRRDFDRHFDRDRDRGRDRDRDRDHDRDHYRR
jgi:hypothetical protein